MVIGLSEVTKYQVLFHDHHGVSQEGTLAECHCWRKAFFSLFGFHEKEDSDSSLLKLTRPVSPTSGLCVMLYNESSSGDSML